MAAQEGDVLFFQTTDGGDINVEGGITEMTARFDTAAYLAMFGGNAKDDGRDDNPNNWWGNYSEVDPDKQYRSETQFIIDSLPNSSNNLRKLQQAAERDLAFFTKTKIANFVSVIVTIPGLNKVNLACRIEAVGGVHEFEFTENWMAAA